MRVAFRVDSSFEIGSGHHMRCLALAGLLKSEGVECIFIGRPLLGNLLHHLGGLYKYEYLPLRDNCSDQIPNVISDAVDTGNVLSQLVVDWLIVDHYGLDFRWEQLIRVKVAKLMVIDDLANRPHVCDLLLDQNVQRKKTDYKKLVPQDTIVLAGPEFALLRSEFQKFRDVSLNRRFNPDLKKILISMGGIDKNNVVKDMLFAVNECNLPSSIFVTIVLGIKAPWEAEVRQLSSKLRFKTKIFANVQNMAELMTDSDLVIGAFGISALERCCLGLPSINMVLAENQKPGALALSAAGAALVIESPSCLKDVLNSKLESDSMATFLCNMTKSAMNIADGLGGGRVVKHLLYGNE